MKESCTQVSLSCLIIINHVKYRIILKHAYLLMFIDREWNLVVKQVPKVDFSLVRVGYLFCGSLKCLTTPTP